MESKVLGYCAVAAVLGIIAAATGFAGEATRVKASEVYIVFDTCVYPSSPALALGIVSAVFTIITRIYISVSFGGAGCCRTDPNSTPISKLLFVFSWVASVIAVALLLAAAGLNNRQGGQVDSYGYITCYVVKPGIFAAGAILALLSAAFGIAAYLTLAPPQQTTTNAAVAFPMGAMNMNVDPEKNPTPVPFPPQQYPPPQY
ncbi:protein MODIFYING WALL LIGNIN-1-like [Rutidosis leptorrhynchoides]|uniref:protein MODIFYING WALL LIGNIN-1-like n=1 Tax=Rutidosis leptorrhynchoides TaxID=125765 RepID=UPI003A99A2FF